MNVPVSINARFRKQVLTGVQRFATEVSSLLANDPAIESQEIIPGNQGGGMWGHAWEQFILPKSVGSNALFSPANTGPLSITRQLVVIHDAAVWDQPHGFTRKFRALYQWLLPRLAKKCRIATVSQFSRQRLSHFLNLPESAISVFGNAVSPLFQPASNGASSEVPYVLCVGSLDPRKNFATLIKAWQQLCQSGKISDEVELRIAGSANPLAFKDLGIPAKLSRVRWLGAVSDTELVSLYQHASAFVFPSVYEGFGIPPLEAMACGCPVVMSSSTSLPEVGGPQFEVEDSQSTGAVFYFDPNDSEAMATQLEKSLLLNETQLARMRNNALQRSSEFTWAGVAKKVQRTLLEEFG